VVSNGGTYITPDETKPGIDKNIDDIYAVKAFKESHRQSLWLNTYTLDTSPPKCTGLFNNKGIYSLSSLKSQGILIINITEDYLFRLISDIKPLTTEESI